VVELVLKDPQGLRGTTALLGSGCGLVQDTAVTGRVWYSVSGCAPVEGQLVAVVVVTCFVQVVLAVAAGRGKQSRVSVKQLGGSLGSRQCPTTRSEPVRA